MTQLPGFAAPAAVGYTVADTLADAPLRPAVLPANASDRAGRTLKAAAAAWFGVAVLGQWLFVGYVAGFYGRAAIQGDFARWNQVLPRGYVPGESVGNALVALHLAFAAVIMVGGALQLLPALRRRAPVFHRWNGRLYLLAAVVLGLGGLIMVWTRGSVGDLTQHLGVSVNALVILACAGMALSHARARCFDAHRRWALRLFLAVGGVWFFRIGLSFWLLLNQGPVGFDPETFTGPFLSFLAFAQYLLPLAVLELYFRAQANGGLRLRLAVAGLLAVLTLATATGIVAASLMLWLPRL